MAGYSLKQLLCLAEPQGRIAKLYTMKQNNVGPNVDVVKQGDIQCNKLPQKGC